MFSRQGLKIHNCINPNDEADLDDLEDFEDYMEMLASKGMSWEILAHICLVGVCKVWPEIRGMGDALSFRNPLHGTMFWYIVKYFMCYTVTNYHLDIPGLSLSDGNEENLSSHATIEAIATAKIDALTSVCLEQGVKVPDFSQFFFQVHSAESLGNEDSPAESDVEGEDEDEDEEEHDEEDGHTHKKKKVAAV